MILYGSYTSPYVRHCRIALIQAEIDYEFVETDALASSELSPTQKVPMLVDGDNTFTDSSTIVRYIREQSQQTYLASIEEQELFCLANTLLDTAVNMFMLNKYDGIAIHHSEYLTRQNLRIDTLLGALNNDSLAMQPPYNDAELRLATTLAWVNYRQRFSFSQYERLIEFMNEIESLEAFKQTAAPIL